MSSHYRFMVETPEANLVAGIRCLQNRAQRNQRCDSEFGASHVVNRCNFRTSGDGRAVGDETRHRINELVGSHLTKLGHDASGWVVLYRGPNDGRL
jgi:hypothetical protein